MFLLNWAPSTQLKCKCMGKEGGLTQSQILAAKDGALRSEGNYRTLTQSVPVEYSAETRRGFVVPGAQFNRNNFGLSFGLKNHLSFGLRFPTLRKNSKMGSLDMSQNQNGISV